MAKKIARPAQGNNSKPGRAPRPAYVADTAPQVVSQGSVSKPRDTRWSAATLKTRPADRTPRIVKNR